MSLLAENVMVTGKTCYDRSTIFLAMGPKRPLITNGCCSLLADVSCLLRPKGAAQTRDTYLRPALRIRCVFGSSRF